MAGTHAKENLVTRGTKVALSQGWHSLGAGSSELAQHVSWANPRTPKDGGDFLGTAPQSSEVPASLFIAQG